jgi:outer membrane protein assembly factor BamB
MRRPAALLALASAAWAGCAGTPFDPLRPVVAAGSSTPSLAVRWRRLLTPPDLIEYKPQEFAAAASDGAHVFIGSRGGTFFALRPRDGEVVWKIHIEGGVSGQPLYYAPLGTLFVGGDDGAMRALDPATGREKWIYRTKGPIAAAPVFDDGLLYFTNGENRIYCLDAHTGAWKWQYDREAPESFTIRGFASPLLFGGRAYVGFADGYLAALNAKSGDVIWARSLGGEGQRFVDVDATPALVDGTLYVSSYAGGVFALEPGDGGVKWKFDVEGATTVRVEEGRVYFAATRAGLHCLDLEGHLVWRQALARQGELSPPVLVGERLLLVSASEGGTYVVDRRTGRLLQFFDPGHGVTAMPYSDGAQVYLLTNTGFFYAFLIEGAA